MPEDLEGRRPASTGTLPKEWEPPVPAGYGSLDGPPKPKDRERVQRVVGALSTFTKAAIERVSNGVSDLRLPDINLRDIRLPDVHIDLARLTPESTDDTATGLPAPPLAPAWAPADGDHAGPGHRPDPYRATTETPSVRALAALRHKLRPAPTDLSRLDLPAVRPVPPAEPDAAPVGSRPADVRPADPRSTDLRATTAPLPVFPPADSATVRPQLRPEPDGPSRPGPDGESSPVSDPVSPSESVPSRGRSTEPSPPPESALTRGPSTETSPLTRSWGPPLQPALQPPARQRASVSTPETTAFRPWDQGDPTDSLDRTALLERLALAEAAPRDWVRTRQGTVRTTRTVRHLNIRSVVRLSLAFYSLALVVLVLAGLFLWLVADVSGALTAIDKAIKSLFALKSYRLHPGMVVAYTAAAGVILAIAGTIANVIMALVYNLVVRLVGGIRVEVEETPR